MYFFPLMFVILAAIALSLSKNGIGSFVTLGTVGAAVYTMPAFLNMQSALATLSSARQAFVPVPEISLFVVTMAWLAYFAGLLASVLVFRRTRFATVPEAGDPVLRSVALSSLALGSLGILYLAFVAESTFFFLEERAEQDISPILILWRWAPVMGMIAAAQCRSRKLFLMNAAILGVIFLRGDRTIVAIATAALIAVVSEISPGWWKRLKPLQIAGFVLCAAVVFLGKSMYLTIKSGLSGQGWSLIELSLKDQLLYQFEPIGTFSHLSFVITSGLTIPLRDFFLSVFANVLLIPSAFGISTNLYNSMVTDALATRLGYGVAGNYLAHGYAVAGLMGVVAFYFILPLMLTVCDRQFHKRTGTVKVFWCCVGAVFAFYIHRNGLDNQLSFVRQLFIISVLTAIIAAAIRQLRGQATPSRWRSRRRPVREGPGDDEFALHRPGTA